MVVSDGEEQTEMVVNLGYNVMVRQKVGERRGREV